MKLYNRNEIINKFGKPIYYFSNSIGNTDLEKFKNSFIFNSNITEYKIESDTNMLSCFVDYNESEHSENCGYFMKVFNETGEMVEDTFPSYELMDNSKESVEEVLSDLGFL